MTDELAAKRKAHDVGRTSTRFEREQQLAQSRGFRTAHEMRKARNKRSTARYVPPANQEPNTPLLDRLEGGSGPVRVIMRDGKWLGSYSTADLTPQHLVVSPPEISPYSLSTKQVHQYQQTKGRK